MNQQQRSYLKKRIQEIREQKIRDINGRDKSPNMYVEVAEAIRNGELTLDTHSVMESILRIVTPKKHQEYGHYIDPVGVTLKLEDIFPELVSKRQKLKDMSNFQFQQKQGEIKKIQEMANDATDKAMLGADYVEAMTLLQSLMDI